MMNKNRKNDCCFSVMLALLVEFIYYFLGAKWSAEGKYSNIVIYILGAVIFFIVYLISMYGLNKIQLCEMNKLSGIIIFLLVLASGFLYFVKAFQAETQTFPWFPSAYFRHLIPAVVYVVVLALGVALICSAMVDKIREEYRSRIIFVVLIVLVQTIFLYCPNPFNDSFGGILHLDAYTNSIINSLNYAPHEQYSASVYGHYSLFFIIPCKVLQLMGVNQWHAVAMMIAVVGGIGFAIGYWLLHKLIKNNIVFMLVVLACAVVSTEIFENQYFQMMPHRYLFQTVTLAIFYKVCSEQNSDKQRFYKIIGWLLAACGILWNIETGIVCAIVWMVGVIYLESKTVEKWKISVFTKNIVLLLLAFLSAYGIVNAYNLIVGGNLISLSVFIYPIGSDTYVIESLKLALQNPWGPYFIVIAVMLGTIGFYLKDFWKHKLNQKQVTIFLAAVMGYGVYTYYMNRAVEGSNASIVTYTFVLILAVLCDNMSMNLSFYKAYESPFLYGTGFLALIVLTSMMISTVSSFGKTLSLKLTTTYDETNIRLTTEELKEKIPNETVAFGMGTAQLFAYADRKTGLYITDWPDLETMVGGEDIANPFALEYLNDMLEQNDYQYILVRGEQVGYVPDDYVVIDNVQFNGVAMFWLYEKIR